MEPNTETLMVKQNEVMIGLLARLTIGSEHIRTTVTQKKRNPQGYIATYNALDGSTGVVEAAKMAGVDKSTMSSILKKWQSAGIIYDVSNSSKPAYKRVLEISVQGQPGDES